MLRIASEDRNVIQIFIDYIIIINVSKWQYEMTD